MSYDHRKDTSFDLTSTLFLPDASSSSSSRLTVEFDFFLKSDKLILVEVRDSGAQFLQHFPPSYRRASASAVVEDGEPESSLDDMVDAVDEAIGDTVDEEDVVGMVWKAWEGVVSRSFLTGTGALRKHGVLRLRFEVRIENWHVYVVGGGGGGGDRMVPAMEMLEKYEVRGGEEMGCCICLEDIDGGGGGGRGGGALRMPCMHVFHGGCISEWLRKRRSCPLCRYEIPTE